MKRSVLALDFGASSGRAILATYDGTAIHLQGSTSLCQRTTSGERPSVLECPGTDESAGNRAAKSISAGFL